VNVLFGYPRCGTEIGDDIKNAGIAFDLAQRASGRRLQRLHSMFRVPGRSRRDAVTSLRNKGIDGIIGIPFRRSTGRPKRAYQFNEAQETGKAGHSTVHVWARQLQIEVQDSMLAGQRPFAPEPNTFKPIHAVADRNRC